MSRLTLRLPETLHQQLVNLADSEGVSLNQYIVYSLTRQVASAYTVRPVSEADVNMQKQMFKSLLQELGEASPSEVEAALNERELVQPEEEMNSEAVARLQQRIRDAVEASS
ncbi:toxin-antitoxin system HicB family antitoxin [Synechococcus sp. PCC 7336]|uniref:toxin-antitoxin system HicB family antitoxin n=1 Tax=Synechococcus sp. PCC 7336 TaxID=195250 RepID=UPI0003454445|nr:toxin-antitoxin system HicB family antitoxin [Synechococcus sp. PCC 7336]